MDFDAIPWTIAEGGVNGMPLLIRFRDFARLFPRELFGQRLNIFWKMTEPDPGGLGSPAENHRLQLFEERLISAVEPSNHSVLSVVLTTDGSREWVFHTGDVQGFLSRLSAMPQETERYPIEVHSNDDPEWAYDASVTVTVPPPKGG